MCTILRNKFKITWISYTALDKELHAVSRIEILNQLNKKGYSVHFIASYSDKKYVSDVNGSKITVVPIKKIPILSPIFFGIIILLYLPYEIIKNKPNILITDSYYPIFGFLWKKIFPNRIFISILDIRSTPIDNNFFKNLNFVLSVYIAKNIFQGITIITKGMKNEIIKDYDVENDFIGVWSDAASLSLFKNEKYLNEKIKLRKKFGLMNKFIVIYHGDITIRRGVLNCVKAIRDTIPKTPEIVLFLLGSGKDIPKIKKYIDDNNLDSNVIIYGPVKYKDVPKYIAMADIGIVPLPDLSIWRNQCPLKLLEYLSMEKVIVLTDITAHKEIIGDKKCGIFIKKSNYKDISKALIYCFKNKSKLKDWGIIGRKIIEDKYNWDKSCKDLENFLYKKFNDIK